MTLCTDCLGSQVHTDCLPELSAVPTIKPIYNSLLSDQQPPSYCRKMTGFNTRSNNILPICSYHGHLKEGSISKAVEKLNWKVKTQNAHTFFKGGWSWISLSSWEPYTSRCTLFRVFYTVSLTEGQWNTIFKNLAFEKKWEENRKERNILEQVAWIHELHIICQVTVYVSYCLVQEYSKT